MSAFAFHSTYDLHQLKKSVAPTPGYSGPGCRFPPFPVQIAPHPKNLNGGKSNDKDQFTRVLPVVLSRRVCRRFRRGGRRAPGGGCAVTSPTGGRADNASAASGPGPSHGHDPRECRSVAFPHDWWGRPNKKRGGLP